MENKHKDIVLDNRYGDKNVLSFWYKGRTKEHILWYRLKFQNEKLSLNCAYFNEKPKQYYFIDPSGGPKMTVGKFEIEDMVLHKIVFKKGQGFTLGFIKKYKS